MQLVNKFLEVVSGLLLPLRGKEKAPALNSCLRASPFQQRRGAPGESSTWGCEDHARLLISEQLGAKVFWGTSCHPSTWQGGDQHPKVVPQMEGRMSTFIWGPGVAGWQTWTFVSKENCLRARPRGSWVQTTTWARRVEWEATGKSWDGERGVGREK